MFSEDDLLPLSALQHLLFCERRAALVHLEGLWAENVATQEGAHLHEKAHHPGLESRRDLRVARGVPLRSLRLGLSGKADVVEFHGARTSGPPKEGGNASRTTIGPEVCAPGVSLPGVAGFWTPFPVEYKRGKLRKEDGYEIQLCAQALCLEEMLSCAIPGGAIFYGKSRRRVDVEFSPSLRRETEDAARRLHALVLSGRTPRAFREPKCERCSLLELCLPDANRPGRSAAVYLGQVFGAQGP